MNLPSDLLLDRIVFSMLMVLVLSLLIPVEADSKPRTVCWEKTVPHLSMQHRIPCKGLINRIPKITKDPIDWGKQ